MIELNKDNFEEEVLQRQGLIVVDFWSPSCVPCQDLLPKVEELAKETEAVPFGSVDVSKARRLAISQKIMSIPSVVFYKDGVQEKTFVGGDATIENIKSALNELI